MNIFSSLGFRWDRSAVPMAVATHSIELVTFRFHRMLPEFVWDASMLEGNPFTFPEVKTLLEGVTIGGRKISDQEHVLNLASGFKHLLALVKDGSAIEAARRRGDRGKVGLGALFAELGLISPCDVLLRDRAGAS